MRVVALTFHDVKAESPEHATAPNDEFYQIRASEFDALLSELRRLGYRSISSKTFRSWQQGQTKLPERTVVLTFDDGYASHFEVVAPALLRHRFSGTFFVTTQRIGQPGFMTWDQLRKLLFLGMEIGSHGASHKPLTNLKAEELRDELVQSKRELEQQLGVPIGSLAAPGGFWNKTVADATRQAGYEAVWISAIGTNGPETNALALRRVVVRQPFALQRLIAVVEGRPSAFWWIASQQQLIRLCKRVLGLYWYEKLKRKLVPNA